jgi:hypothetical protein
MKTRGSVFAGAFVVVVTGVVVVVVVVVVVAVVAGVVVVDVGVVEVTTSEERVVGVIDADVACVGVVVLVSPRRGSGGFTFC